MSYGKELSGGFTPKEEKLMKQKAKDEKKRKEEEKRRVSVDLLFNCSNYLKIGQF